MKITRHTLTFSCRSGCIIKRLINGFPNLAFKMFSCVPLSIQFHYSLCYVVVKSGVWWYIIMRVWMCLRETERISVFVFFECPGKPLPRKLVYIGMLYMYTRPVCLYVLVVYVLTPVIFNFACYFAPLIVECKTVNGLINCFCLSPKLLIALFAVFPIIFDNCFTIDIPAATLPA